MAAKKKKKAAKKSKTAAKKKAAAKKPVGKKAAAKKTKTTAAKKAKPAAKKKPVAQKKQKKAKAAPKKQAPKKQPAPVAAEPARVVPSGPLDPSVELAHAVAALALDKKAEDVVILKVTDLTSYADCFILASAPSERQVQAIARHVGDEMKKAGKAPVGTEGLEQGHWVLVDMGAVVLHVFLSSARQYYDLEGFWSDAPRIDVDEKRGLDLVAKMTSEHAANRAAADGADEAPADEPQASDDDGDDDAEAAAPDAG